MSKELRAIVISSAVALALCVGLSVWQCSFLGTDFEALTRGISNGTFASGVIYLSLGVLSKLSMSGPLGGLRYITYTLGMKIRKFTHKEEADATLMSYFDFLKQQVEKEHISARFLLLPGLGCLILAVAATALNMTA